MVHLKIGRKNETFRASRNDQFQVNHWLSEKMLALFLRVFTFDQRRIESGYIWVIYDHLFINSTVPQVSSLPFCNMRFSQWSMLEPE